MSLDKQLELVLDESLIAHALINEKTIRVSLMLHECFRGFWRWSFRLMRHCISGLMAESREVEFSLDLKLFFVRFS